MACCQRKKVIGAPLRKARKARAPYVDRRPLWEGSGPQDWNPCERYRFDEGTEYEPWMVYVASDGYTFIPPFFRAEHGDAPGHAAIARKNWKQSLRDADRDVSPDPPSSVEETQSRESLMTLLSSARKR